MTVLAAELIALIISFADRQRGFVTRAQLYRCGLDRKAAHRLVARGWLRPVHRGVYRVGHAAPVPLMRETAAILAYAPNAVLVHRSSLALWKILPANDAVDVHLGVQGRTCRSRDGIVVHRAEKLQPCDVVRRERLPVTTPARALLEAACDLGLHETERAVDEALALGLLDRPALLSTLGRYPGHRGAGILRALADPGRASEITASAAAERLAMLLRKAGAPRSRSEYPIGPYRADRCWPELKLVVEVDGVQFHRDRKRMESDNRRQDYLRHRGYVVVRFTARQVMHEPEYVLFRIGHELGLLGATTA